MKRKRVRTTYEAGRLFEREMMKYYEDLLSRLHPNDPYRKSIEKKLIDLKNRNVIP